MPSVLAILLIGATAQSAASQSPYELYLGMHSRQVDVQVGSQVLKKLKETSRESDEEWEAAGFRVHFCRNIVTAVMIELPPDMDSWIRAVSQEYRERGAPQFHRPEPVVHTVEVSWRLQDGSELSYSMQYLKPELMVSRWHSARKRCAP